MRRFAMVALACLAIAGCNEVTEEQREHAQAVLPSDCKIYHVGQYGSVTDMYVVRCLGSTTTTFRPQQQGKVTVSHEYVWAD